MSKKFPLSKQKHRSKLKLKHLKNRHLDEPVEESDTPVMRIHSQVHSNQSEAVQDMQDCRVGSYNAQISTVLQSNIQQKTRAVTEENVLEQSSCKELFSTLSDIYSDAEQQSHRTAAEIQTIQPKKARGSVLNEHKRKASVGCAGQVESKCKDCPSLERRKSKRTRTDFVNKVSDDSVIDKDSEATSNILLHYVSESSPEKYITRTCDTATAISLPLTEQASSDQELKCSTANENHSLLNVRVNAHETRQGVGKTDPSRGTGPVRKLSKLAKFRRNIIKSKMPSKIASELPEKCLRIRKMLTPASKTCIAHSKSIRPGVRSPSGVGIEGNVSKSRTNVSYLSSIPQDHSSSVGNGFVNLNTCNNSVNLHLTCNSGTDQIFSSTDIVKETCSTEEIHTESNHAEIADCSQDRIPKSDIITETASPLSKVDHASEIHSDSSLPDKILETVTVPAVPVCHKESVPEANQTAEGMGHVTLPHTCLDADYTSENVTKVRSPDKTREAVADFTDFESPATIFKMDEMKNEIFPRICQELVLCPVSPIKDPVVGELKLKSEMVESSATASDKKQIAELPVNGSSIKSPKRLTRSSLHQKTGSEITAEKCAVNTSTDLKVFPGCVLRWVLKYYEVECKEKHPKKSKFMTDKLKTKEVMKQQEKVIFKKELQELFSSNFSSGKFQQVLQKFAGLNSETTPLVLAKIIVKFVSDDINAQPNHTKSNSAPPLTQTQQRLVTLVYTLQSQHQQYKDLLETILLGIEYRLFRLGHVPNVIRSCSLARFHAALCLIRQDRQRVQAFCYDSMYCLYYKAFPLLFTVYTTYPDALPHASVGKDSMLMMTMTNLILMQSTDKTQTEYRIEAFKKLLQTRYGYSQRVLTTEQLFQVLVDRLRSSGGHVEGLEASLILVAKRIGWDRSYKQLLCRNLVPLIDEWRAGAVNDLTIREVIIVMGYITRCFPVMEAKACVQAVLNLLGSVLLEQNVSMEVQEAAAFSLLRLSRHNFCYVSDVLAKWQPSRSNVLGTLLEEMLLFFETRNVKWWHNFLKRKRVCF
ncbi:uncharacterized protein LOC110838051 [Zootermopsis nevadensis]|uniref:Uncharacterized protein n=1 Tax=Zootermopsis nevadensis TaxID=136037 RepID=A0A067QME0_ZOONE|nr:uncharacterized protein LOC110838051 [Zootermopsis nevadensis]KDR10341.1 hypothetical protein L798_15403 [Zootermopsis nevadensis]